MCLHFPKEPQPVVTGKTSWIIYIYVYTYIYVYSQSISTCCDEITTEWTLSFPWFFSKSLPHRHSGAVGPQGHLGAPRGCCASSACSACCAWWASSACCGWIAWRRSASVAQTSKCERSGSYTHPMTDPCMLYMVTFTINIPQMLAYIPYMDPMGMVNKH